MPTHRLAPWTLSLLCASVLAACGGGGSDGNEAPPAPAPVPATPQLSMALDPSFGEQGRVRLPHGDWGSQLLHIESLSDGKLLLLLSQNGPALAMPSTLPPTENEWASRSVHLQQPNQLMAMRLLPNGQLDTSYGSTPGITPMGVLGSESANQVLFTHNGGLYVELLSTEPCVEISDIVLQGSGGTRHDRCLRPPNTPDAPAAQMAKRTTTWVQLTPDGKLVDSNALDAAHLNLTSAERRISVAFSMPSPVSWTHRATTHHWRFIGSRTDVGWSPPYNWAVSPIAIPGEPAAAFTHIQSACQMKYATPTEDETGQIWTVSHSDRSPTQPLCMERFSPSGQALLSAPVHLPLKAESVALAQAAQGTVRVIAWQRPDTPAGEVTPPAHLVWAQFDDAGRALPHGTSGVIAGPLPAATDFTSTTLNPASHFLPDGSAWLYATQQHFQDVSVPPQAFALHLNANGDVTRNWDTNGWVPLTGEAATAKLRLVDANGRWLMLADGATGPSLIRVQGHASP